MSIAVSIFCLWLAQTASPQPMQASWPAELKASLTGGGFQQSSYYNGWQVGGGASATWYPVAPLVDDGTPLAMQAYLQRLDRLSFDLGISGFGAKDDLSLYEHSGHSANLALSGLFYLHDLVLGGRFYYGRAYDFQHPAALSGLTADEQHTTQLINPELTLGLRLDTIQFQGSYRFKIYFDDGSVRPAQWGQLVALLEGSVEQAEFWKVSGYTVPHGGGVSGYLEAFSTPQLGIWFDAFFERGQLYLNSQLDYDRQGLEFGVGWWQSSSFELQFSVSLTAAARAVPNATTMLTGLGTLAIVTRAPQRHRAQVAPPSESVPADFPPRPVLPTKPAAPPQPALPAQPEPPQTTPSPRDELPPLTTPTQESETPPQQQPPDSSPPATPIPDPGASP